VKIANKSLLFLFLAISLSSNIGCSFRDPNARKQRYLESGKQYFRKGKYQEAAIQFQNAIQIDKYSAEAHHQLAQCFLRQSAWPSAYRELSHTVELEPKNWTARIELANFFFAMRQFQNARDRALAILNENTSDVDAKILLANSDAELGNVQSASEEAEQAVRMAPDQSRPYLTLGLIQEKTQQFSAAERTLQKAVSIDSKFVPARLGLGGFYQRRERWAEAETEYRAAIETDLGNIIPRSSLASIYLLQGKKDEAEQVIREAKMTMATDPAGYRILGDFYLATGDREKAAAEFADLSRKHPHDFFVKKRYIQLLIQNQQFDQATKLNEEILKQNSKDVESLTLKGQALNLQQRPAEAVPILEAAVKGNLQDPAAHFQLGVSYSMTGNQAGAEKEWREAVRLNPPMLDAQERLGALALHNGHIGQLEQSASEWLKYAPAAPQGYLMRGTARTKRGDVSGAEKDLRKAIELDSRNVMGYTRLGDLYLAQKHYPEARRFYEQALGYDPRAGEALQGLANSFLLQEQPQKALSRVQAQLAVVPDSSSFYFLLGQTLLGNQKVEEAKTALATAAELDKTNLGALLLLAQVQEATGRPAEAASTYERTIGAIPWDVRSYVAYGLLEEHVGNWRKAQELYQKSLQIQPDEPSAANNLGYLLLEHGGDTNYALSLAQIARRGMPNSPNTADTLAWAYYRTGVYSSAIDLFRIAVKMAPTNPAYHYHLGLAYQKADKVALARSSLQRALQLDPKSSRAEEIRQTLAELSEPR